ncbi:hypothetical protein FOCC_FOCC014899 [Frankliniella occidentalis]|nr:hypothetical protein FOCC_FOCC014899 [Frankliniella occidentalis]
MSFIVRWGLEEKAIEHLLRLIDCHLPVSCLQSKYLFLKKFPLGNSMTMRYFCPSCGELLPPGVTGEVECGDCQHHCDIDVLKFKGPFFVQMSVGEQVQRVMSDSKLVQVMRKDCDEADVISGKVYKRFRTRGTIGDDDISLQWNTDGVSPCTTSKVQMYPIQACINELPARIRKDNILLCGLYYGKKKPDINIILKPFVEELEVLRERGVVCNIPGRVGPVTVKVHTILCSVDSVARPTLQGINQYNGRYGCSFCLKRGMYIQRGNGRARIYLDNIFIPRSHAQHMAALWRLEELRAINPARKQYQGIRRGSVLLLLPGFNIIRSFVPDYMHSVLEGVVVAMWDHWRCAEYEHQGWYLNAEKRRLIDERLVSIRPPSEVTRPPRSIDTEMKYWRAHEIKSFFLYYSLVCLKGILPDKYLKHWLLLVYSITIFLREKIVEDDFLKAKAAIEKFVHDVAVLYPNCHHMYKFNMHLLLHIPKAVEDYGALWASSTFPYEHFNGVLTRLVKGTQSVPSQICRSFVRLKTVTQRSRVTFSRNDCSVRAKQLYECIVGKYYCEKSEFFAEGVRLFGSADRHNLTLLERVAIQEALGGRVIEDECNSYRRMICHGTVFHASVYRSLAVRDNSYAKLWDETHVKIYRIVIVKIFNSPERYCFTICEFLQDTGENFCHIRDPGISVKSVLQPCRRTQRLLAVLPENIGQKCVGMTLNETLYLVPVVNNRERD